MITMGKSRNSVRVASFSSFVPRKPSIGHVSRDSISSRVHLADPSWTLISRNYWDFAMCLILHAYHSFARNVSRHIGHWMESKASSCLEICHLLYFQYYPPLHIPPLDHQSLRLSFLPNIFIHFYIHKISCFPKTMVYKVLLFGATGYLGGTLLTELERTDEYDVTSVVRAEREGVLKDRNTKLLVVGSLNDHTHRLSGIFLWRAVSYITLINPPYLGLTWWARQNRRRKRRGRHRHQCRDFRRPRAHKGHQPRPGKGQSSPFAEGRPRPRLRHAAHWVKAYGQSRGCAKVQWPERCADRGHCRQRVAPVDWSRVSFPMMRRIARNWETSAFS